LGRKSDFRSAKASHALNTGGKVCQERSVTTTEEDVGSRNDPTRFRPICGLDGNDVLTELAVPCECGGEGVVREDVARVFVATRLWGRSVALCGTSLGPGEFALGGSAMGRLVCGGDIALLAIYPK
jgi:hypothetical protein